jgi:hypothetical protein
LQRQDAYAVFAVTDFAEQARRHGRLKAEDAEYQQGVNLAQAAAASATLQHYIWSTIPSASSVSKGRIAVPHFESKARVDEYILNNHKRLSEKTTFLWVGYYGSNVLGPAMKPTFHATSGKEVWLSPVVASTEIAMIGSPKDNVGVFVQAILSRPDITLPAKYVMAEAECLSLGEIISIYASATGRPSQLIDVGPAAFTELFPEWGAVCKMLQYFELLGTGSFAKAGITPVTRADLGVDETQLVLTKDVVKTLL